MTFVLVGLAIATLALAGLLLWRGQRPNANAPAAALTRKAEAPPRRAPGAGEAGTSGTSGTSAPHAAPQPASAKPPSPADGRMAPTAGPVAEPPAALAAFHLLHADEADAQRQASYVAVFGRIPRPSRLLNHLLSPEFLNAAGSLQLVELITAEPLIAAKVLATVNSPQYGLKTPLSGIGQAVTYLGLNAVRSACLQYILISTLQADSPQRQRALEVTWRASALASELAQQLSQRLNLPDAGQLVSAVVLSFLGRLGTTAVMPQAVLAEVPARDLLARSAAEQERFGLSSGEIGRLLMREWGLPAALVRDAADIDRLLVTPRAALAAEHSHRLALGYLCARLGERLAAGECQELLSFEPAAGTDAELHHLRGHLDDPRLARLADYLRAPMLSGDLQRMLRAWG